MDIDDREELARSVEIAKARIEKRHQLEQERRDATAARLLSRGRTRGEKRAIRAAKSKQYRHDETGRRHRGSARGGFLDWCFAWFFKTLMFGFAAAAGVALILGLRMLANMYGVQWVGDF